MKQEKDDIKLIAGIECIHCGYDILLFWSLKVDGEIMYCPHCGEPMKVYDDKTEDEKK